MQGRISRARDDIVGGWTVEDRLEGLLGCRVAAVT